MEADVTDLLLAMAETIAELQAKVAALEGAQQDDEPILDRPELIDTAAAARRFDLPPDTLRKLATRKAFGMKSGGRWMFDVQALAVYLGRDAKQDKRDTKRDTVS